MQLTRRNTIIGLGTLAAGVGVISGSSAFSSVEADRSFQVSVTGDSEALLGLEATNDTIVRGGDDSTIYFELPENRSLDNNWDSVFQNAFKITNNGPDQTIEIEITLPDDLDGVEFTLADERDENTPTDLASDTGSVRLAQGESKSVDLRINTNEGGYSDRPGNPYQITIRADAVD